MTSAKSLAPSLVLSVVLAGFAAQCLAADEPLFRYDGEAYTILDASPRVRRLLFELESEHYRNQQELVDEILFETYLETEAARRGVAPSELARELLATEPPDEQALREFYERHEAQIGQPYEAVRSRIDEHLRGERLRARKAELLSRVKAEGGFELLLAPPQAPPIDIATEGHPRKGAESPRVTIVEFADYQCPHCRRAARVLQRIVEAYPDDVAVIYMDFPINRSGISRAVAEGAACADRQGRFWDYHDLAFARQSELDHDSPAEIARDLGLDEEAFAECLSGPAAKARVAHAESEAHRLGLRATPSIFVNGRPLSSRHLERDLERLIDEALAAEPS